MDIVLNQDDFVNNKLIVSYGTRQQAEFTIIDEEFAGMNTIGRVNRVTCIVKNLDVSGAVIDASMGTMVIGLGDGKVGVTTTKPELRGAVLSKDTMADCVVTLYEV